MSKKNLQSKLLLLVMLVIFWMIIASSISLIELIFGIFSSILIVIYSHDLILTTDQRPKVSFKSFIALFLMFLTLIKEIIIANFLVAKLVLSKNMKIDPGFQKIRQPLKKDLNKALYGNAITLTPGTLTVEMTSDYIIVHGLIKDHIQNVEGSKLEKVFMNLEGEGK
jgi:multicomponent Na+:H+ antiporter subunit E